MFSKKYFQVPCVNTLSILDQPLEHILVDFVLGHLALAKHVAEHAVIGNAGEAVDVVVGTPREVRVKKSLVV